MTQQLLIYSALEVGIVAANYRSNIDDVSGSLRLFLFSVILSRSFDE
ncbi:MAG: hypothetical protein IJQ85_03495 [Selenomonadaceae bacterium]|nr:hypothetical protein [Selenomonadaceae bacterium]